MMEPSARHIRLTPEQLAGIRRRTGDFSDRTIAEACAVGLSYWATGRSPDGIDLSPGTLFPDVLGWVDNGGRGGAAPRAGTDDTSVALPEGAAPDEARLALDDLADFPDRPLGTIAPVGAAARREELARWNDTGADRVRPTLMELFREQARTRPDALAVVDEHRALTYREVAALSAQLAHRLRRLGLTAEQVVGISLERSADMVVGLLGVLQAGCAFVPLDPHWPAARRAVVVEDARVAVQLNARGSSPRANRPRWPWTSPTGDTAHCPPRHRTSPSPATHWPTSSSPRARPDAPRAP